jgi:hypothetical protein
MNDEEDITIWTAMKRVIKRKVYTWLLQTRVIHKTSDITIRLFEHWGVCDGVWSINNTLWIEKTPITYSKQVYW